MIHLWSTPPTMLKLLCIFVLLFRSTYSAIKVSFGDDTGDSRSSFLAPNPQYFRPIMEVQAHNYPNEAPDGTSSLAFVFDITGSMYDDLVQVRDGAKRIFATVLEQREKLIHNYVLVPFHDPQVGPEEVTTDTSYFQRKLANLYVQGGTDCPEMSIGGIKLALERALPASFIYVFTDARSKDYHLTDQVLNLIQQKQSRVVFVMTGDCGNRTHPGYIAYERIASASSGQIFHLEKADVNQVLEYVRIMVQTREVHIEHIDKNMGGTFLINIPSDSHLNEITFSLAGEDASINLIGPDGSSVAGLIEVVALPEVNIVQIKAPKSGIYQLRTNTGGRKYSLRVTGIGHIDFAHGFSTFAVGDIDRTYRRPRKGQMCYLYVNMTGMLPPAVVNDISLVDTAGNRLFTSPARVHSESPYLYHVGPFSPPQGSYFVKVNGVDDKNYEFQRISRTSVSPEEAGGPMTYMAAKTSGFRGDSVNLTCSIDSQIPYTLYWYSGDSQLAGPIFFKATSESVWTIASVKLQDRGTYRCSVTSAAGNHTSSTFLETREPPPHIVAPRNVTVQVDSTAYLHCRTQSVGQASITWQRRGVPLQSTDHFTIMGNGTLRISKVSMADEGPYVCHVITRGGDASATIFLTVLEPPKVIVDPPELYFVQAGTFNLSCIVRGDPTPEAVWYFQGNRIRPGGKYYITYKYDLIVRGAQPRDAGSYECRAISTAGQASAYTTTKLAVPPKISVRSDREMIGRGDRVVLECQVISGTPTPDITWQRNGREIAAFRYITIDGGRLTIQAAQDTDAGMYTCVAQNMAGRAEERVKVDVGSIPSIVPAPETVNVNIERDVTLQCRATGHPKPDIQWKKENRPIGSGGRYQILPDGALLIRNANLGDAARYTCTASNRFGRQDANRNLVVTGLISPVLGHVSPEEQVIEKDTLRLSCVVVLGTPKPTLSWLKDNRPVLSGGNLIVEGQGSGLIIRGAQQADEGRYTCIATNAAGNASVNINVQVISKPVIEADKLTYVVNQGSRLEIPCRPIGRPTPSVSWSKGTRPLLLSSSDYALQPGGSLLIYRIQSEDAGLYSCIATNSAGKHTRTVSVSVRVKPTITPDRASYVAIQGHSMTMTCEAHGDPPPIVEWFKDGQPVSSDKSIGPDGSLTISNARGEDRGQYSCKATNSVGYAERSVTLNVHTAPIIIGSGEVKVITVNVNDTVKFACPARAEPPPTRIWNYEGRQVFRGYSYGSELRFTGEGALEIDRSQMQHAGTYSCQVSNLAGNDSITYLLKVRDPPRIVSNIPGTIDVVLDLQLRIPCRAIGTPIPSVSWKKDGLELFANDVYKIDADNTLRIEHSQLQHEGQYTCVARNDAGVDSRVTNVVVQEPPVILPSTKTDYVAVENDRVEMRCTASGKPQPEIHWFRRGQILQNNVDIKILTEEGRLIVTNVKNTDHGPYVCRAVNAAGEDEKDVKLTVIVPPDIPDQGVIVNEEVLVGGPFTLYCPVFSTPIPQITWKLNGRPVADDESNVEFSEDKRRMHILKARVTDAGVYKCEARNQAGVSTKTFNVEVLVPPNLDESKWKRKVSVIQTHPVTLNCPVSGIPDPEISWLANGQLLIPGQSTRGMELSEDGKAVVIQSAQLDHEGSFTCVATNKAGSLDIDVQLTVLAPPLLEGNEVIEVVQGLMVAMNCNPKEDGLTSTITWLKDNINLQDSADNIQIAVGGKRVFITKAQLRNAGDYECLVRNTAGESKKTYKLIVLVPPEFREKTYEQNQEVTEGNSLVLRCDVTGSPDPQVIWTRNGEELSINSVNGIDLREENQMLRVSEVYQNGGVSRYSCLASNKAGSISRDFFISVIAPPELGQDGERRVIEVIKGASVLMECPVTGSYGNMDMKWTKDGLPIQDQSQPNLQISLDRIRLHMINVVEADEAIYRCTARNPAGEANKEFQLIVIVPPQIVGGLVEDVTVLEGQSVTLRCEFSAVPPPSVNWRKNDHGLNERTQLLSENTTVYINSAIESDGGSYFCMVQNKAGRVEKTFNVRVILKPQIRGADEETEVEVLITTPITLECPVVNPVGIQMTWTRKDEPVTSSTPRMQVLAGGRHLHIASANRDDAGRYMCQAKNEAGSATKRFKLTVLIPPSIIGDGGLYSVVENNSLTLPCETDGIPTPVISWTKESGDASRLPTTEVLSEGQQFRIGQAENAHDGAYLCTAKNKVGMADLGFDVDVISKPAVAQSIKDIIEVVVGHSADFRCPTTENQRHSGTITWLRDGRPFSTQASAKYQLSGNSRKLHLRDAKLTDEGRYGCRIKNPAGETTVDFRLIVLEPPQILILEKDKNRRVVENTTLTLSCPASGKPDPLIAWYKDGEPLDDTRLIQWMPGARITGNQLMMPSVRVDDSGRFTCMASNKAGMAEQDITVYVMTVPRIEREGIPDSIEGILGRRVTMNCPAFGRPQPEVTWLRAGRPVTSTDTNVYFSASGQKLHFISVSQQDLDRYICVAKNPAGEDKRDFDLQVLVAPSISGSNVPRNVQIIIGRSAVLECPAEGSPEPTIAWLKNGQPVVENESMKIIGGGKQLQISQAQLDHTARYTCIASNPIGVVDLDTFVDVVGPPKVEGPALEIVEVVKSKGTSLDCGITGTAPLDFEWLYNGESLLKTPRGPYIQTAAQGRKLHILAAQTTDAGQYICVGRNRAGEARKTVELKVLVPPSINKTSSSPSLQQIVPGHSFKIECRVSGNPLPIIEWRKDGQTFTPSPEDEAVKLLYNGQTLWFTRADTMYEARYTCSATNKVGVANKDFIIQMRGPPTVDQGVVKKEVNVGDYVILTCQATGGTGKMEFSWKVDGQPVQNDPQDRPSVRVQDRRVEISDARLSDTARYTCIIKNDAGEAHKHFDLTVLEPPRFLDVTNLSPSINLGRPLILDCSVAGTPKPTVSWSKDGESVEEGDGRFINDRQQYQIGSAQEDHQGRYSCVADNKAGRADKDLLVQVLMPPELYSAPDVLEVPENDTETLVCPVKFMEGVDIQWSKNGVPITTSDNVQLSASGKKLHIMKSRRGNAGRYACLVKNEAGQANMEVQVITLVPPQIHNPGFRTMESILNQTVQMECRTTGIPQPTVSWSKDGRPLLAGSQTVLLNNGSVLRLVGVQESQEGRYTCTATNKVGKAEADTFLEVIAPPLIAPGPSELKVIVDQGQTIRCEVSGNPKPTVEWTKNNHPFQSALVHSSYDSHYIHLVEAQVRDAGRYTCLAKNRAGEARRTIDLSVLVPPTIRPSERVLHVIENRSLVIECHAQGSPRPVVTWKKDGEQIEADQQKYRVDGYRLSILNAQSSQVGRYNCEAKNEAGVASVDFAVDVWEKPVFKDLNPDVRVVEGERATLQCNAEAKPVAEIRWLKGGRPLAHEGNIILSPRGETLMILSTGKADAGSYSCLAKNAAGESEAPFTVTVLVAPHIDVQLDQNPRVITGQEIIIACPVIGAPTPEVEWKKNGVPVVYEAGRYEQINERDLKISNVVADDSGRYTCHAYNLAGHLDTDFATQVIAPPKFGSGLTEYEVILSDTISMDCSVEANPRPTIAWQKGDQAVYLDRNVWISGDGQQLTIGQSRLSDGGRYTCKATNVAGTTNVEMMLHVLVPPTIDKSNIIGNPLAIANKSIHLECPASGVPSPTVRWEKAGDPVPISDSRISYSDNNQTLRITPVRPEDAGRYECIAENKAGSAEQDFNLEVLLPPKLGESGRKKYRITQGESLLLTCPVLDHASAEPTVSWTKDGRPLDALQVPNMRFSSEQKRLHITSATLNDAGVFTCVASNRAGETQLQFEVEVLSPPEIDGGRNDPVPRVIIGKAQTLWCMVSGNPFPEVTWMKDANPLTPTQLRSKYRLLDKDQGLEIRDAEPTDTGRYTCVAKNDAGQKELDIALDVWVAPRVSLSYEQAIGKLDTNITLYCTGAGNPEPTLAWSKDGQVLFTSPLGARITGDGKRLDIPRLRRTDVGRYTCTARNDAGVAEASVDVDVLVPPVISRENVDMNPRLPSGQTLTLHCDATGKPQPDLEWFHQDRIIASSGGKRKLAEDGRYLQINNIGLEDVGVYKCVATNPAGEDTIVFNTEVVQSPIISGGGTIQVIEGEPANITCDARGVPRPNILWQRNGQRIDSRGRFHLTDTSLVISSTTTQDAGIYVCVSTNEAGTAQQAYTLEVLVPPKIFDTTPEPIDVPVGKPFSLLCGARGYPEPEITWFLNGRSLTNSRRHSVDGKGTITVDRATVDDAGQYKCRATNAAGQDEYEYQPRIIRPPIMTDTGIQIINVTQGDPAQLLCQVQEPIPKMAWYKDGNYMTASTSPSTQFEGQDTLVRFRDTRLTDEGDYRCVAQNPAGNATRLFRLNVGVPPKINEMDRRVIATNASRTQITCTAIGYPDPTITWLQDSNPVSPNLQRGNSIVFNQTNTEDAGIYTCQAKNWAGTAFKDVELVVHVPPTVIPDKMNITAKERETVEIPCEARGIPTPLVDWFREPSIQITGGGKYRRNGNSLIIHDIKSEDASFYRCVAKNEAGVGVGYRRVTVEVPQINSTVVWVECDELGRPITTVYAPKRGDVAGDNTDLLPWKTEFQSGLPANNTDGIIIRCYPNSGHPASELDKLDGKPIIVGLPKNQLIDAGSTLSLQCGAIGIPTPTIEWIFNDTLIPNQPASHKGNSTLQILSMENKHQGTYACLARNEYGTTRAMATVRVRPKQREQEAASAIGLSMISRRPVAVLSCHVTAPGTKTQWKRGDYPIGTNAAEHQLLRNGSLLVFDIQQDLGMYRCVINSEDSEPDVAQVFVEERQPEVFVYPKTQEVAEDRRVMIHCRVLPESVTTQIFWFRNSLPVIENKRVQILPNATLIIQSAESEDRGVYRCMASNTMGQTFDESSLVISGNGGWSSWSPWSVCTAPCAGGKRQRFRTCQSPQVRVRGTPQRQVQFRRTPDLDLVAHDLDRWRKEDEDDRFRFMMDYSPENVDLCPGDAKQTQPCNNHQCSGTTTAAPPRFTPNEHDMPSRMLGYLTGRVNNVEFNAQNMMGNVTPVMDSNQIFVRIETLPLDLSPVSRAALGFVTAPCWALSYPNNGGVNGHKLTNGIYDQNSQYQFHTGEQLRVRQSAQGVDAGGYLVLDTLVDGHTPQFPEQHVVTVDPFTETYVQNGPGLVHGAGSGTLRVGQHYAVPFRWHHNITYNPDNGMPMPSRAEKLRVDAIDLTTENSFTDKNFGYILKSSSVPMKDCPKGYAQEDDTTCSDIDECMEGTHSCNDFAHCQNIQGSYICSGECSNGYYMAQHGDCEDVNECALGQATCDAGKECVNTAGSYTCLEACINGYRRDSRGFCTDVDECREQIPCHPERTCINTPGSFRCLCQPGYVAHIDDGPCHDLNECAVVPSPCQYGCYNVPGSFHCYCPPQMMLSPDQRSCSPAVGSSLGGFKNRLAHAPVNRVDHRMNRVNGPSDPASPGCPPGYEWTGKDCQDIDECVLNRPCQFHCENRVGDYKCSCPPGYKLMMDGTCEDLNECVTGEHTCGADALCFNEFGGFKCIDRPCPQFYTFDSATRECKLDCSSGNGECPESLSHLAQVIQVHLLALPNSVPPHQDLLRLTAYDHAGRMLRNSRFSIQNRDRAGFSPFNIRLQNGRGTIYTSHVLSDANNYRLNIEEILEEFGMFMLVLATRQQRLGRSMKSTDLMEDDFCCLSTLPTIISHILSILSTIVLVACACCNKKKTNTEDSKTVAAGNEPLAVEAPVNIEGKGPEISKKSETEVSELPSAKKTEGEPSSPSETQVTKMKTHTQTQSGVEANDTPSSEQENKSGSPTPVVSPTPSTPKASPAAKGGGGAGKDAKKPESKDGTGTQSLFRATAMTLVEKFKKHKENELKGELKVDKKKDKKKKKKNSSSPKTESVRKAKDKGGMATMAKDFQTVGGEATEYGYAGAGTKTQPFQKESHGGQTQLTAPTQMGAQTALDGLGTTTSKHD